MWLLSATALDFSGLNLGIKDIFFRFLCAMAVGLIVGLEREYTHRPAGMRTHILVALGSCAVMITGQTIFTQYFPYGATPDPARLAAQVISGVGFLGAGTILREGANVKGLTTAASLWAVACMGIAAGAGYYGIALAGTLLIFVTLTIFEFLQNLLLRSKGSRRDYVIDTTDVVVAIQSINNLSQSNMCKIHDIQVKNQDDGTCRVSFRADFGRGRTRRRMQSFLHGLVTTPSISLVQDADEVVSIK